MAAVDEGIPAIERVIVAIDSTEPDATLPMVSALTDVGVRWFKVGLATWIAGGPGFVEALRHRNARVFLDLKLHDIPHQVGLATRAAVRCGAELLTIHSTGGAEMVAAARDGADGRAKILAVTVLTSLASSERLVTERALAAVGAGADGLVCSPLEVSAVREAVGPAAILVTPGVRPAWATRDDQKRVATPYDALKAGSDLLVIGRPITRDPSPSEAVQRIVSELSP